MTRPDRLYRARTLLHRAGYQATTSKDDPGGGRTLLLEVVVRPEDDADCIGRIIHGCDPDARRMH